MPKKLSTSEFIKRAKQIHGDKYDYSKVNYVNSMTKVCVICPIHGEFFVRPNDLVHKKVGCGKCNEKYKVKTIEEFKEKLFSIRPECKNKLEIPNSDIYVNNKTKISVICHEKDKYGREHGMFLIRPNDLISGYSCPKCGNNYKKTTEDFIFESNIIHNNKFDYSKTVYKGANTKVCIICHEKDKYGNEHGEFWQTPINHINGCGCPTCNNGKKSHKETEIYNILLNCGFKVERQKTFKWLKHKGNLFLDFYLPEYNVAIEYQGEQHFRPIIKFGGQQDFELRKKRDEIKNKLCKKHEIPIIYLRKNINETDLLKQINETSSTKKV